MRRHAPAGKADRQEVDRVVAEALTVPRAPVPLSPFDALPADPLADMDALRLYLATAPPIA